MNLTSPIDWAERGALADPVIRFGIRRLLRRRLRETREAAGPDTETYNRTFAERLRSLPVADATDEANAQHYELPVNFFEHMLGPRLKYSACYYRNGDEDLAEAERNMLHLTCERAGIGNGMSVLELGCGWGSLTLYMAATYPEATVTAVTNSSVQAEHVRRRAREQGLADRVQVVHADINTFRTDEDYDRIVSVEMFEHVRNYGQLFERLRGWLRPGGKLFVHIFSHRSLPYLFETEGDDNWMGRYFFTGGTMPSHRLLPLFAEGMRLERDWRIDGRHYARTLEDWLVRLDASRGEALAELAEHYGSGRPSRVWLQRWRIFLMACAELFAYRDGEEWGVSHLLFVRS